MNTAVIVFVLFVTIICSYHSISLFYWTGITLVILLITSIFCLLTGTTGIIIWIIFIILFSLLNIKFLRKPLSNYIFRALKKSLPNLSKTEETALNAGDTWMEKDFFQGNLNWKSLHNIEKHILTDEEQNFINNEVTNLCSMIDDWDVMQTKDLPVKVWEYMKEKNFFGLVIDKKYGGKGFSARAHSDIIMKISSCSGVGGVSVMVPNSLGPAELLQRYGTKDQKNKYLPRLADGREIPCFALTELNAGSDATSIISGGVICKKKIDNKEILGMQISFNKRYITLAPIATLIGLAVNLKDPDNLLSGCGSPGITCVLLEHTCEGLKIGNRHIPSALPFMNGPVRGEDIFVSLDQIIGGQKMTGEGWRMLVECLSIGRSISLPALSAASSAISTISTSAYSCLRRQFGIKIGCFEGVEEVLARIAGMSYIIQATREITVVAVDAGKRPSVASAIAKYHMTEKARSILLDAMDVHGGRAVVLGPRNYLATNYFGAPISITVEGANIMTRNLLIFGQGAMACHPFIQKELYAINEVDVKKAKRQFDELLWKHMGYTLKNFIRTFISNISIGIFIKPPSSYLSSYYKDLTRISYGFAWISDLSLLYLGSALKRKERLSARLGDVLAYMYLAAATLKYFHDYGANKDELIYAKWSLQYCLYMAQEAMLDFIRNFPSKSLGYLMKTVLFPYGNRFKAPNDIIEHKLAKLSMTNNNYRERIIKKIYLSPDDKYGLNLVESAFQKVLASDAIYKKITKAIKNKKITKTIMVKMIKIALEKKIITESEYIQIIEAEGAREDAMNVDEFSFNDFTAKSLNSLI